MACLQIRQFALTICALVAFSANLVSAENILLLLPMTTKSMAYIFEPIAYALSERGHHLTIVTPMKFKNLPLSSPNVTQMVPIQVEEFVKDYPDTFDIRRENKLWNLQVPWQQKYCHKLYDNTKFYNLQHQNFDLVLVNIFFQDCFAGMLYKMGSPIIFVASLPVPSPMTELFGTHLPSSYLPAFPLGDISAQLDFRQRVKNFLMNAYISVMIDLWTKPYLENIYRQRLADPNLPGINEIYKKQGSMILINSHFGLTSPRPYLPNIVEIGGVHCKPAKELPNDLKEWTDGAKEGFVVFSLGSIVRAVHMPENVRTAFIKAFSKLNEKVIWKWELDEGMEDLPKNVKLVKYLPQQDLLGHPNIKLFITHGGLLSTEEAVYHGVPVIGMPIFIDQDTNMRQAEILGFGIKGEILDITEEKLTPLIRRVLDDPRYMQKAKKLSGIFRDQQETPVERAVFWTEYVLRHKGAPHLRSPAANLNQFQYHCIDVIIFLAFGIITVLLFAYNLLKLLFKILVWVFSSSRKSSSKTKTS